MPLEEAQTAMEVRHDCSVECEGWGGHYDLSPHTPVPDSAGTGRDSCLRKCVHAPVAALSPSAWMNVCPPFGHHLLPAPASVGSKGGSTGGSVYSPVIATLSLSHLTEQAWPTQLLPLSPLTWVGSRCLRMAHIQSWGQNQS